MSGGCPLPRIKIAFKTKFYEPVADQYWEIIMPVNLNQLPKKIFKSVEYVIV